MSDKEPKISLEDLLSLKRQEKPNQEFWESFSRELKEKTLQAAIKKPSFYSRVTDFCKIHFKVLAPASVAALFALTLFSSAPLGVQSSNSNLFADGVAVSSASLSSVHQNLLQNNIREDVRSFESFSSSQISPSFSRGVHYLAGSVASIGVDSSVKSNLLY